VTATGAQPDAEHASAADAAAGQSTAAIETWGLSKRYGATVALDRVDLRVARGETLGLLGPNGAGKTTLVKLLLGLTRPSAGGGRILGRPLGDEAARARLGYLPELFRHPAWLTADEVLALHCELAALPRHRRAGEIGRVLGTVDLAKERGRRVGSFSKGMQQRLGLAVALLGDPELVILDEPTSALDPLGREEVRAIVREAARRGSTVVLNSHLLGEVERSCQRVAILDRGRVIATGPPDGLLGEPVVRLHVTGLEDPLGLLGGFGPLTVDGERLTITRLGAERVPDVVASIVAAGGRVHAVEPVRPSLEDAFMAILRASGRDQRGPTR
jgi:ABC-2 type transport system ATP-binding protein